MFNRIDIIWQNYSGQAWGWAPPSKPLSHFRGLRCAARNIILASLRSKTRLLVVCKIPLLARALGLKARATIGYLVYKIVSRTALFVVCKMPLLARAFSHYRRFQRVRIVNQVVIYAWPTMSPIDQWAGLRGVDIQHSRPNRGHATLGPLACNACIQKSLLTYQRSVLNLCYLGWF